MSACLFLKQFLLDHRQIPELQAIYHHVYFKGVQDKYIAANDAMLRFIGIDEHAQLERSTASELIKNPLALNMVLANDKIILDNKCTKVFQEPYYAENQNTYFLSIKSPLYSEHQLIGLCGVSLLIDGFNFSDFNTVITKIANLLQEDWSSDARRRLFKQRPQPKLTPRELECLYFYMRGHSIKNIACMLELSNRTIEFYIDNIKAKLGVNKRSELLPLAFGLYPELL